MQCIMVNYSFKTLMIMKKLYIFIAALAMVCFGAVSAKAQLITSASGDVGIGAFPTIGKLDVRGDNIFQSPITSSFGLPSQFIGFGKPGGTCDIYGVRIQRLNSTNISVDRFLNLGVKAVSNFVAAQPSFSADLQLSPAASRFEPITSNISDLQDPIDIGGPVITPFPGPVPVPTTTFQPVIAWGNANGSLEFEYDEVSGCGTTVFELFQNTGAVQAQLYGHFRATNIFISSDSNLKNSITGIDNAVGLIEQLDAKAYELNEQAFTSPDADGVGQTHLGYIAQDVQRINPSWVSTDEQGTLGINYIELIPVLTEAIKARQGTIEDTAQQIASLKQQIAELKAMVDAR